MMLIGIDPHKSSHTATAVDPATNSDLGSVRIDASFADYRKLLSWARQWPERRWAMENPVGLGHHLALWLVAMGELAVDVAPPAAACVAALHGDARAVHAETHADSVALLDERRKDLSSNRTRSVNQFHTLLRELLPGGVPTDLTAAKAAVVLRGLRPVTTTDRVRKSLARELVSDIRSFALTLKSSYLTN
ncbi:hypothetical protein ACIBEK_36245 [Nocardia fusca]|uniref:hypothetical protein n=1 Tax=Nocardia fusca TaxID=941183 RepID=UPI0037A63C63